MKNLTITLALNCLISANLFATSKKANVIYEDYSCYEGTRLKQQTFSQATCVAYLEEPSDPNSIWAGARFHAYSGWIDVSDSYGTEYGYARLAYCQSKRDANLALNTLLSVLIGSGLCDAQKSHISKVSRYRN
ncbi:MAG: hypothetical protein R3A80_08180 [Bdellovibrionota bacterium]